MPQTHFILTSRQWWLGHFLLPLLIWLTLFGMATRWEWDLTLAGWLFQLEGGVSDWPLRHLWWMDKVLHSGGRNLVVLASVLLLLSLLSSLFIERLKPYRRGLIYLLCSVASSVLLVRFGKDLTQVNCPWDLQDFGGKYPYMPFPMSLGGPGFGGQCFPGGHSSGAFAWVALYYFAAVYVPQRRWQLLSLALIIGLIFSLTQELRGAHFMSHDITSMWLSWFIATLMYPVCWPSALRLGNAAAEADVGGVADTTEAVEQQ